MGIDITYYERSPLGAQAMTDLFAAAWGGSGQMDVTRFARYSLTYIAAFAGETQIGFVNVVWDGGIHAFLLDTTVHPAYQRHGIGRELVRRATASARERGMHWLHVDYEPHLEGFYRGCGFFHTAAGLIDLAGQR